MVATICARLDGKIEAGGLKFKVLGDDSSDFKFKIKNKNK